MIGSLRGTLLSKHPPALTVEVGGVGYELEAPMSTHFNLPAVGQPVLLHTHLLPREDALQLFGFATLAERVLFRALIRVTGVGARMALAVLSGMSPDEFAACVRDNDLARLIRVPGIGRKTAERLVIELRDRVGDLPALAGTVPGASVLDAGAGEAVAALVALGYRPADAERMARAAAQVLAERDEAATTESLLRAALKEAARA